MYHPIEVNGFWQRSARKLKTAGYQYRRLENSVIPGVFSRGDESVYLMAEEVRRGAQRWVPVSARDLPDEFNPRFASAHAGVSIITIKTEISRGRLPARRAGKRALIISNADLLAWMKSRPSRGCVSRTPRTRCALETIAHVGLKSMLRAAMHRNDVDFKRLFSVIARNGTVDPESLMLSDIDSFQESIDGLSRQDLIEVLEVK